MQINKIPFCKIRGADLIVDTVYEGGEDKNIKSEVLSKITHVGNAGGFRKCYKKDDQGRRTDELAYVCIYTTGEEIEWCDELDRTLGRFTYYGDNRKAGNPITHTKAGGNEFLQMIFNYLAAGLRTKIPPIFVFEKYCGRDIMFLGVAVPGDQRINPQDALVALWAQNKEGRYQNYRAYFTILDIPQIDHNWLDDLIQGYGYDSQYAPAVWKRWVKAAEYRPLITEKNPIQYRKKNEQLPPHGTNGFSMLERLIEYFPDPYDFEKCACKIAQLMDPNIVTIETTRRTRDGGRDAVGKYRIGPPAAGIELEFALEAKRYKTENSVGVKETSRLISRIKHRQFGIFVTTSFIGDQAYKEIIEDEQPIVIVSGKDIIDILMRSGINDVQLLDEWLMTNF